MSGQPYILVNQVTGKVMQSGVAINAEKAFAHEIPGEQKVFLTDVRVEDTGSIYWDFDAEQVAPKIELTPPVLSGTAPFLLDTSQFPEGCSLTVLNEASEVIDASKEDPPEFQDSGSYRVIAKPADQRHLPAVFDVTVV